MSFYTNYIKNKNLYIKINQTGGTVCGCGCKTSNILSLAQASASVESEYCVCGSQGHTHGNYFFKGELTNLLNEPYLIKYLADFHTPYNIIETKVLRERGMEPIFNSRWPQTVPEWYAPKEQIDVPYFLPSDNKSILTVCIPINTVNPDIIELVNVVKNGDDYSAECSICGGSVDWNRYIWSGDKTSNCTCGLPDTMAVFEIKIENLCNQDGNYSYKNFEAFVNNICDTLESEISRSIPNIMALNRDNIVYFFQIHHDIVLIDDYNDEDD